MTKEYASLRRKTFFVPVIGAFLLLWLVLAVGYAVHERIVASGAPNGWRNCLQAPVRP